MAETSAISWCDSTWNPWLGCDKISPACDFCYAEAWANRAGRPELWKGERRLTATWNEPLKWQSNHAAFQRKNGRRQRVFTASLADFFDNKANPEWRKKAWELIRRCDALEWYIVTKRISNVEKMLPDDWGQEFPAPYQHVVIIITVVNQKEADRDVPRLIELKMKYPWLRIGLSIEPMLGPIDLCRINPGHGFCLNSLTGHEVDEGKFGELTPPDRFARLDWVIAGGESGGNARAVNIQWLRTLRDQCAKAGVPFHFKQWGEFAPAMFSGSYFHPVTGNEHFEPQAASKRTVDFGGGWGAVRVGKAKMDRFLDGARHDGFPREEAA